MRGRRILWLDGLKGLACMFVFVHHFLVGFYPAAYFGEGAGAHIARFPGLEAALASSPIAFLVNGHFLVCVFCVVSGAVLGARMLSDPTPAAAGDMMLRRYFRFALPVFAVQSIAFVMSRTGLFFSGRMGPELVGSAWLSGYFAEPIAISRLFVSSFVTTEFVGDNLIGVTWMLYQMFIGGLLSMLLCLFGARSRRGALAAACLWAAGLLFRRDMYACFALGALLAMLQRPPARGAASKAAFALAVAGGVFWAAIRPQPPRRASTGSFRSSRRRAAAPRCSGIRSARFCCCWALARSSCRKGCSPAARCCFWGASPFPSIWCIFPSSVRCPASYSCA